MHHVYIYRNLLKIRPWVTNVSGCSKRGVGAFLRTLSSKIGSPKYSKKPPRFVMSKIAAKQYRKNSNLYK